MSKVFIELFAGTAAVTNALYDMVVPCSRNGCKQGYSSEIIKYLGIENPEYVILVDTDPGLCKALKATFEDPQLLADRVGWITDAYKDPRHCWDWAMSEKETNEAAWWLATSGRYRGIGKYRGPHKNRPNSDGGFSPSRRSLEKRMRARKPIPQVDVIHAPASSITPVKGDVTVYIDNVYEGTTPYEWDVPESTGEIALEWAENGAKVVVSEGRPLVELHQFGFKSVDISNLKKGQSRKDTNNHSEFLTYI